MGGRHVRRAHEAAGVPFWAAQLFEPAVNAVVQTTSPRAWAFALIGIHEYLRRMSGDRLMNQHRDTLTARLIELYRAKRERRLAMVRATVPRTTTPSCRTR